MKFRVIFGIAGLAIGAAAGAYWGGKQVKSVYVDEVDALHAELDDTYQRFNEERAEHKAVVQSYEDAKGDTDHLSALAARYRGEVIKDVDTPHEDDDEEDELPFPEEPGDIFEISRRQAATLDSEIDVVALTYYVVDKILVDETDDVLPVKPYVYLGRDLAATVDTRDDVLLYIMHKAKETLYEISVVRDISYYRGDMHDYDEVEDDEDEDE